MIRLTRHKDPAAVKSPLGDTKSRIAPLALVFGLGAATLARGEPIDLLNFDVASQARGALAVLGISAVPNQTANVLRIDTADTGDAQFFATQLGGGFSLRGDYPLYLEGYLGFSRYDPKYVLSAGLEESVLPTKWNSLSGTVGVGWNVPLTRELRLRPILNGSLGYIESDVSLLGAIVEEELQTKFDFLDGGHLSAFGYGASLMLDYERYREACEIDVELRYTLLRLQDFGGSAEAVRGTSDAQSLNYWSRVRVPSGFTAFGGPVRLVGELAASWLIGDQRIAIGSDYLLQVGGGVELDVGAVKWAPVSRIRLVGRYVLGDKVDGVSVGMAVSF